MFPKDFLLKQENLHQSLNIHLVLNNQLLWGKVETCVVEENFH